MHVRSAEQHEGDEVVGMTVVEEGKTILTVSETGYGRKSDFDNYRVQTRGGKGLINYHVEKYGDIAAVTSVSDNDDIILIASDGIIIRIPADGISTFARPSKGVRVMRVTEGEKLITITPVEHEDAETEENTEPAETESEAPQEETTQDN